MKLRNRLNGGTVTVSEKYAERLIASGEWESAEPKPRAKAKPRVSAKAKED